MSLTPKQEKFAHVYVQTSNASEAYRQAYDAQRMKPEVIAVKACELLKSGNVSVRVQELKDAARSRHEMTVDDILRELEEARTAASTGERPQAGAMVAATMGKAKVLGLIIDKAEVKGNMAMTLYDGEQAARMAAMLNGTQPG